MTGLAASILLQMALLTTGAQPYQEALDSSKTDGQPLLVLVGAEWCPGCVTMKHNVLARMEQGGRLKKVNYTVVDYDRNTSIARGLMRGGSIPQIIVFNKTADGWHREQVTGAISEGQVQGMIARAITAAEKSAEVAAAKAKAAADADAAKPAVIEAASTEVSTKTDSQ